MQTPPAVPTARFFVTAAGERESRPGPDRARDGVDLQRAPSGAAIDAPAPIDSAVGDGVRETSQLRERREVRHGEQTPDG